MSDRATRFSEDFAHGLVGQQQTQLLQLFNVNSLKEMMKVARTMETDMQSLQEEAQTYLSKKHIQRCLDFAHSQTKLPAECAFALQAYTRNDVYKELNELLRDGKDLHEYKHLCICLIKGLALLPLYEGKVFRGIGNVQVEDVRFRNYNNNP